MYQALYESFIATDRKFLRWAVKYDVPDGSTAVSVALTMRLDFDINPLFGCSSQPYCATTRCTLPTSETRAASCARTAMHSRSPPITLLAYLKNKRGTLPQCYKWYWYTDTLYWQSPRGRRYNQARPSARQADSDTGIRWFEVQKQRAALRLVGDFQAGCGRKCRL